MTDDQLIKKLMKISNDLISEEHKLSYELKDLTLMILNRFNRFKEQLTQKDR